MIFSLLKSTEQEAPSFDPRLKLDPFPYMVLDDVLSPAVIDEINRNWPEEMNTEEVGHSNFIFEYGPHTVASMGKEKHTFWERFFETSYRPILADMVQAFAPFIASQLGEVPKKVCWGRHFMLMDSGATPNHEVHHHYHSSPLWQMTMLLYVDNLDQSRNGTRIYRMTGNDAATNAYWHPMWGEMPHQREEAHIEYRPNRLFVFYDCPLSLHGVDYNPPLPVPGGRRGRRVIRTHVAVKPQSWMPKLYGISQDEFKDRFIEQPRKPEFEEWLRRDIDRVRNAKPLDRKQQKLARKIRLPHMLEYPDHASPDI